MQVSSHIVQAAFLDPEQDTKWDKPLTSSFSKAAFSTYRWQLLTQILVLQGGSWDRMWHKEAQTTLVSRWWGLAGGGSPCTAEQAKLWQAFSTADSDTWPAGFLPHFLGSARCCSACASDCQWQKGLPLIMSSPQSPLKIMAAMVKNSFWTVWGQY